MAVFLKVPPDWETHGRSQLRQSALTWGEGIGKDANSVNSLNDAVRTFEVQGAAGRGSACNGSYEDRGELHNEKPLYRGSSSQNASAVV